jgi:hypothetical protein
MGTALVASIAAATAQGATVVYTSQSSFLAAAGGVGPADTFNGLGPTTSGGAVTGAFNDFAYSAALSPSLPSGTGLGVLADPGSSDRYLVANAYNFELRFRIRIAFNGADPVTAVGANMFRFNQNANPSLAGSVGGDMEVRLYNTSGTLFHIENFVSMGRSTFLGFTSDVAIGFLEVRSANSGTDLSRYGAMDNLYYGAAIIPLPPAAWAGLGMLGLMGGVRAVRRRG